MKNLIVIIVCLWAINGFAQTGAEDQLMLLAPKIQYTVTQASTTDNDVASCGFARSLLVASDFKGGVDAATTGPITLSGEQNIDGYSAVTGDRILVKNQLSNPQNGAYTVSSSAWTRTDDMDTWTELYRSSVFTVNGVVNSGSTFTSTITETGTLGSDPITWTKTGETQYPDLPGINIDYTRGKIIVQQGALKDSTSTIYTEGDLTETITGLDISGDGKSLNGDLELSLSSGYEIPTSAELDNAASGYNDKIVSLAVTGINNKTLTLTQQDGGQISNTFTDLDDIQNLSYTNSTRVLAIDGTGSTDVTLPLATTTYAGLASAADKTKLDGIESGANNYTHPTGDGNHHVPATSTTNNGKVLTAGVTAGSESWQTPTNSMVYPGTGIGISTGSAWGTSITDNHTNWDAGYTYRLTSASGTAPLTLTLASNGLTGSVAIATTSVAGSMSAADKTKLDGIASGATNYTHPSGDGNHHVPATSTTNNGKVLTAGATAGSESWVTPTNSMVYPGAGIPLSTGSAWGTSITNNSANWNTAYGWGNWAHTTLTGYGITDATPLAHKTTEDAINGLVKVNGSGTYSAVTDNSTNWTSGYTYRVTSASGTAPLTLTLASNGITGSIAAATTSAAGSMSSADKTKLDGIATGATNYTHPTGDGNLHVPATSTTNNGKVLTAGATAGSMSWASAGGYTLPAATTSALGGVQISGTDGGFTMSGNFLLQDDYILTTRAPLTTDWISFWKVADGAQGKMQISTLLALAGGSMTYPGAGIALSTGSAWGTSITNNSANWNTAYGWGNWAHTTLTGYGITDATPLAHKTTEDAINGLVKVNGSGTYSAVTDNSTNWAAGYTYRVTSASGTAPLTLTLASNGLTGSVAAATTSVAGSMSAADKTKLDGIATGATNYTHPIGDGNLHVPANGTSNSGKILTAGATGGSYTWETPTFSSLWTSVTGGIYRVSGCVSIGTISANFAHALHVTSDNPSSSTSYFSNTSSGTAVEILNTGTGIGVIGCAAANYGGQFCGYGVNLASGSLAVSGTARINSDGSFSPPTLTDAAAANNTIYYSSTQTKLVYKDSGGTIHALY